MDPLSTDGLTEPVTTPIADRAAPGSLDDTLAAAPPRTAVVARERGYELGAEIARGAMGRVLRARDLYLRRDVALKLSMLGAGHDGRFQREVELTARLQHPNIVPVYDAGELDGAPFYAMRPIAGLRLDERVAQATTREQRLELLPHVIAVVDAIAYAHRQRVIHRDLKPHNILVGEHGETVVVDWGLGKLLDEPESSAGASEPGESGQTIAGSVLGTVAYMPPEQARGEPADCRSDVYALGCLLFHTLTGLVPQPGAVEVVVARLIDGEGLDLGRAPDLPPELRAIIHKATTPDPARRYQDAGALGADLRRHQAGLLVEAHRYRWHQRLARGLRRHRVAAAVVASVVLSTGAIGGIAIQRVVAERDRANTERAAATGLLGYLVDDLPGKLRATAQLDVLRDASARLDAYYTEVTPARRDSADDLVRLAEIRSLRGELAARAGKRDEGAALSSQALELAREAQGRGAPTAPAMVARLLLERGATLTASERNAEALAAYREGFALLDALPATPERRGIRARATTRVAGIALIESRFDDTAALLATARTALGDGDGRDVVYELTLNTIEFLDAQRRFALRDHAGARAHAELAVAAARRGAQISPWRPDARNAIAGAQNLLGAIALDQGDLATAAAAIGDAVALQRTLRELDPANPEWPPVLASSLSQLAAIRDQQPGTPTADALRDEASRLLDELAARGPENERNRHLHIDILRGRGGAAALARAEQLARGLSDGTRECILIELARDRAAAATAARDLAGARAQLDAAAAILEPIRAALPPCAQFAAFDIVIDRAIATPAGQRRALLDDARAMADRFRGGGVDASIAASLQQRLDEAARAP